VLHPVLHDAHGSSRMNELPLLLPGIPPLVHDLARRMKQHTRPGDVAPPICTRFSAGTSVTDQDSISRNRPLTVGKV
jgi:hypothetical protein